MSFLLQSRNNIVESPDIGRRDAPSDRSLECGQMPAYAFGQISPFLRQSDAERSAISLAHVAPD